MRRPIRPLAQLGVSRNFCLPEAFREMSTRLRNLPSQDLRYSRISNSSELKVVFTFVKFSFKMSIHCAKMLVWKALTAVCEGAFNGGSTATTWVWSGECREVESLQNAFLENRMGDELSGFIARVDRIDSPASTVPRGRG